MQGIKVPQICEMTRTDQKGFKRDFFRLQITSHLQQFSSLIIFIWKVQGIRLLDLAFCLHIVHSYIAFSTWTMFIEFDGISLMIQIFRGEAMIHPPLRRANCFTCFTNHLVWNRCFLFSFFLWIPRSESHLQWNPLTKRPRLIIVAVFQSAFKGDAKTNKSRSLWHCESPWIHGQEYCFKYDIIWFSSSKVMNNHIIPIESNIFPWKRWRRCCCPLSLGFVADVKERSTPQTLRAFVAPCWWTPRRG